MRQRLDAGLARHDGSSFRLKHALSPVEGASDFNHPMRDINKWRDFQNDALIALTARRHGATVVTANFSDFDLLRSELRISVLPVS